MLEKIDLSKELTKDEYKKSMSGLTENLGQLQRKAKELQIPIMIVFDGWDASGKGSLINELLMSLDPREFNIYPINPPNEEEKLRPFFWRFWLRTPAKGRMAIYEKSWYRKVFDERVTDSLPEQEILKYYQRINSFERQLVEDGTVIIKFFLHISPEEQKKRFKDIKKDHPFVWEVMKKDFNQNQKYNQYLAAAEEMIEKTDNNYAPWTVVEANDRKFAAVKIFQVISRTIEEKIKEKENGSRNLPVLELPALNSSILDKLDLSKDLNKEEYGEELKKCQEKIREIEYRMYLARKPLIVLYEGWDAAGKGGNIRRLVQKMDPRGYEVISTAAPNDLEKSHHYLWRFWNALPKAGHVTIFDRTWYGRVLVERVEGFCQAEEWKRAYREINEFEEQLIDYGGVLVKFWLHIDQEEQLKRFKEREQTPNKQWKITEEDWRNRGKWDRYIEALDEMFFRTSTTYAPWTIVEANSKYYARIKTLQTIIEKCETILGNK